MALPQRRCYSIERLLRGVQISSSLSLSLSLSSSSSLSRSHLFHSLPLAEPPDLRFLLVVLVLVLHHLLPHLFTFPLSLIPRPSLPPYLLPPSLIPFPLSLSLSLFPSFIFLSFSRNPTTSSLHDLVVGWRPSLVLPTSHSSSVLMLLFGSHLTRWGERSRRRRRRRWRPLGNLSPSETIRESAAEIRSGVRWPSLYPLINIQP